jgi:hypothetical protein
LRIGAAAVLFHHLRELQFDALVGGKALVAGHAAAAAAHGVAVLVFPGINDLGIFVAAVRTFHASLPRRDA